MVSRRNKNTDEIKEECMEKKNAWNNYIVNRIDANYGKYKMERTTSLLSEAMSIEKILRENGKE